MSARKRRISLLLADRAVRDLAEIEEYSIEEWGDAVADRYMLDIEAALGRIQENPDLLRSEAAFSPHLLFHRVNKHVLVCDRHPSAIFLLTVIHASRDIPSRLADLQPTLKAEVEMLSRRLRQLP
jgi:toxin ParE1/3/4